MLQGSEAIPAYSEEFVTSLQFAQKRIRHRICNAFGLTDEQINARIPPDLRMVEPEEIKARSEGVLLKEEQDTFLYRINKYAMSSALTLSEPQKKLLIQCCNDVVNRFDAILNMRNAVFGKIDENVSWKHDLHQTTYRLNVYANLATLESLMQFKQYGFNDSDCLHLVGAAITLAIDAHVPEPHITIFPRAPIDFKPETEKKWLREILNFAKEEIGNLRKWHRYAKIKTGENTPDQGR